MEVRCVFVGKRDGVSLVLLKNTMVRWFTIPGFIHVYDTIIYTSISITEGTNKFLKIF